VLTLFTVYGFFGWGAGNENLTALENFLISISIMLSFFYLHKTKVKNEAYFSFSCRISSLDLSVIFFLFLALSIMNYKFLSYALVGDELAYAWTSQIHSYLIVTRSLDILPDFLQVFRASHVLHLVSIAILIFLTLFFRNLLRIRSDSVFIAIIMILTLGLRILFYFFSPTAGNNSPLPFAWFFVNSTFLGVNNFGFRIAMNLFFCLGLFIVLRVVLGANYLSNLRALSLIVVFFSLAYVYKISSLIELSNFGFVLNSILVVIVLSKKEGIKQKIFLFLALTFLVRVPSAFLFLPLVFLRVIGGGMRREVIPFFVIAGPSLFHLYSTRLSLRNDNFHNLQTDIQWRFSEFTKGLYSSNFSHLILAIVLSTFFLLRFERQFKEVLWFIFSYSLSGSFFFIFLVESEFVGWAKYNYEFIAPLLIGIISRLIIASQWNLKYRFNDAELLPQYLKRNLSRIVVVSILLMISLWSFHQEKALANRVKQTQLSASNSISATQSVLPILVFNYPGAYDFTSKRFPSICFNTGPVYSAFVDILGKVSLRDLQIQRTVRNDVLSELAAEKKSWTEATITALESSGVSCAIVGPLSNRKQFLEEANASNWSVTWTYFDKKYGTRTFVIERVAPQ